MLVPSKHWKGTVNLSEIQAETWAPLGQEHPGIRPFTV